MLSWTVNSSSCQDKIPSTGNKENKNGEKKGTMIVGDNMLKRY